jgi:hypothetical protein
MLAMLAFYSGLHSGVYGLTRSRRLVQTVPRLCFQ